MYFYIFLSNSQETIINYFSFPFFTMKKKDNPKPFFSHLPPIGAEESFRPRAPTPDPRPQRTEHKGKFILSHLRKVDSSSSILWSISN